jgi:beta-lactamase class A
MDEGSCVPILPMPNRIRFPALIALVALMSACVPRPEAQPRPRPRPPVFVPARPPASRPPVSRPPVTRPPVVRPPAPPADPNFAPTAMVETIKSLWVNFDGKVGIAVARTDGSWMIEQRGGELMPQQSVSKLWVAMALLNAVDEGRVNLSDRVTLTKADLTLFHQPLEDVISDAGYETSLSDLLTRAMTQSDNTANDFLMRRVGGPDAIRAFISARGLGAIRFGPGEKLLQSGTAGLIWKPEYRFGRAFQTARANLSEAARRSAFEAYLANPPDGAAPTAIARALMRLKRGELLSEGSTRLLLSLMAASETGKARIKGGVPSGWAYAHKTGTGQDLSGTTAGYNDVGIMTAPDGTAYAVVVMIARTAQPVPSRQQLMQAISATIGANHRR